MKNSQLDRLLRFAQRTGDRLIITDSEGKQPVVILSLDEYEALLERRAPAAAPAVSEVRSDEELVDLSSIEAAVEAVNREFTEEPKVIPLARKAPASEPSEEQFYMEPV
jgi:PHD/YefM family antitoxin component YafN of YafNO toxin-antitoxin module